MGLRNYMSELAAQNDSDVVYSKSSEPVTKIIPPVANKGGRSTSNTKVIPPTGNSITIKFTGISLTSPKASNSKVIKIKKDDIYKSSSNKQSQQNNTIIEQKPRVVEKKHESENEIIDRLFVASETEEKYKDSWIENYKLANSGKSVGKGIDSKKVKAGLFQIIELNGKLELIVLSDYDTRGKSTKSILNDKWI